MQSDFQGISVSFCSVDLRFVGQLTNTLAFCIFELIPNLN